MLATTGVARASARSARGRPVTLTSGRRPERAAQCDVQGRALSQGDVQGRALNQGDAQAQGAQVRATSRPWALRSGRSRQGEVQGQFGAAPRQGDPSPAVAVVVHDPSITDGLRLDSDGLIAKRSESRG
jgi:hypothetical protein